MADLQEFEAGKGINANKLNENFDLCKTDANANETQLAEIAATALKKDGSNLTQQTVDQFNQNSPNIITNSGVIPLTDNSVNYLTLTGNSEIQLPVISADNTSHTVIMTVSGSEFLLNLGTTKHLLQSFNIDPMQAYNVMYIYNKLDNSWYYCLTQ